MKTNRIAKEKADLGFSLSKDKKQKIETSEKMIRLLERRRKLLLDKMNSQKGCDLKESEILIVKTNDELSKIRNRVIKDKEQYEFSISCQPIVKDSKKNFDKRKNQLFSFWRKCFLFRRKKME